jgi:DNA-binding NtrC family response regulator
MNATILIVDDDPNVRENLSAILGAEYHVQLAATAEQAHEQLAGGEAELALLDLHLQGRAHDRSGLEILKAIRRQESRPVGVIMFTVENDVATAVEAMQLGADHYLSKTCSDEELLLVVRRVLGNVRLQRAQWLKEQEREEEPDQIIGEAPALVQVIEQADRIADRDSPVLILGESGTGKELIARRLHDHSWRRRQKQPFVAVNCAAVPEALAESEFFGHDPGAFTGARKERRTGKFEYADLGTIFLDEIDSMPPALQAKLLRALDMQAFEPLGSNRKIRLRARLVAATKRDLQEAVGAGSFREDLYFRLKGVTLKLPPLRERTEDIPQLVHYFLQKLNRKHGQLIEQVDEEAMQNLMRYKWPGNVRQLYHEIQRIFDLADAETRGITSAMLSENLRQPRLSSSRQFRELPAENLTLREATDLLKQRMIKAAMEKAHGNITHAAETLGLSRRGLQKMLTHLS